MNCVADALTVLPVQTDGEKARTGHPDMQDRVMAQSFHQRNFADPFAACIAKREMLGTYSDGVRTN